MGTMATQNTSSCLPRSHYKRRKLESAAFYSNPKSSCMLAARLTPCSILTLIFKLKEGKWMVEFYVPWW